MNPLKNTRGQALVYDRNFYEGEGLVDGVWEVTKREKMLEAGGNTKQNCLRRGGGGRSKARNCL